MRKDGHDFGDRGSQFVFGVFGAILLIGTLLVATPWAGFHGVLLGCVGALMLLRPPVLRLPRLWWILAALFMVAGSTEFLPCGWFFMPEWRRQLGMLGVETGTMVVIQARQAVETLALFAIMLVTGLWLAGHRASSSQLRVCALAFTVGVAVYAVIARVVVDLPHGGHAGAEAHFGFFPNRNHTATYLAMGAICGLGSVLQALRDKRFAVLVVALVATGVCLWAVAGWSVSRGGIVLVSIGGIVWLAILGKRYLGRHGLWAVGLIFLAAIGLFLLTDSGVKARLSQTMEQGGLVLGPTDEAAMAEAKPAIDSIHGLDFRIPTALDTLDLIGDFPWTGIGAGQYYYVFPQYRKLTAVANEADHYHPESDWLWLAAELGVPATLVMAVLVVLAGWSALAAIWRGRDRALRSACLVAALLVPVHGLFDVPGHRITLAWSAALLFALALDVPASDSKLRPPPVWPFRLAALAMLFAAVWLIRAQWWGGPQPALTVAATTLAEAKRLYQEDRCQQQKAAAIGQSYQPAAVEDRLERALSLLQQAAPVAPLDRSLLRFEGFLAMHFDDKYERVDRCFAQVRALDPAWVEGPLRQAEAWAPIDPSRCAVLWREALRRATRLQADNQWSRERVWNRIRQRAQGQPALELLLPSLE
jgi:hypothetical protein